MDANIAECSRLYANKFEQLGIAADRFIFVPENAITWQRDVDLGFLKKLQDESRKHCLLAFDSNPTCKFDTIHHRSYLVDLVAEVGNATLLSHNLVDFFYPNTNIYFPFFFVITTERKKLPTQRENLQI